MSDTKQFWLNFHDQISTSSRSVPRMADVVFRGEPNTYKLLPSIARSQYHSEGTRAFFDSYEENIMSEIAIGVKTIETIEQLGSDEN